MRGLRLVRGAQRNFSSQYWRAFAQEASEERAERASGFAFKRVYANDKREAEASTASTTSTASNSQQSSSAASVQNEHRGGSGHWSGISELKLRFTDVQPELRLKIGYVPEHFATPLHFAHQRHGLSHFADLVPYPAGTGTMIEAMLAGELDVAIGLTEAWIAGRARVWDKLSKDGELEISPEDGRWINKPYSFLGSYTQSPLTWAISTGGKRTDINDVSELKGKKVGISRIGSGSHVMAAVLAQERGWLTEGSDLPFEPVLCGTFEPLRNAVNDGTADYFMWDHFTSKKFFDNGTLKRIGEIKTLWPAWQIVVRKGLKRKQDNLVYKDFIPGVNRGIQHFNSNKAESVDFITSHMEYSKQDAEAWYEGVRFSDLEQLKRMNKNVFVSTSKILRKAGAISAEAFADST